MIIKTGNYLLKITLKNVGNTINCHVQAREKIEGCEWEPKKIGSGYIGSSAGRLAYIFDTHTGTLRNNPCTRKGNKTTDTHETCFYNFKDCARWIKKLTNYLRTLEEARVKTDEWIILLEEMFADR